jgi:hypothetical protein
VRTTNLASVRESAMRFWRRAAERRSGRGSFDPVTSSNEEVLDALFR